ncbi:MAG TPA: S9 family peptidase [Candidatus Limnocylindria bacterium]|nr:S9 family peptidase [Candidatus Limnocylindria bacterium]
MTDAFDFDAYLKLPRLSGLRVSPDGRRLIVTVGRPAPDGKKMHSSIWELDATGDRRPRRLTRSAPGESSATFARDGSILFTSSRPDPDRGPDDEGEEEETGRLWLLPAEGGEARLLAAPPGGVDAVVAAREADVVVYAASVFPGTGDAATDRQRHEARKKAGVEALLFESFPIRHWDDYLGPRERHLLVAAIPGDDERIGDPADLTPDAGPALVEMAFDVSPDGSRIVTGWMTTDALSRTDYGLQLIDRASGSIRPLTPDDAWYTDPAFSPDGRQVACVRIEKETPEAIGDHTLWLIDLETGEGRDLTPGLDLWPQHPAWMPDGAAIVFTADRQGGGSVHRHELDSGETTPLAGDGTFSDLSIGASGPLYALRTSYTEPPLPVRVSPDAAGPSQPIRSFAALDRDALATLPGRVERLKATADDGVDIGSWLVAPAGATASQPAPLVVWVHGGPVSSWNGWSWRWNPHLLAAQGYAVLLPDPAISTGYGHAFVQRGWGRWGAEPYTDVIAAVDAALERPELDADRTALMGGSFGGYMANWVAANTDRFRAIVTHASLWDLRGFHGTTDYGPDWEREFGDPYADPALYERWTPSRLIANIRTPMLVIHGERDLRVPISEALRLWTDLRRHDVPSRFLYFPDENHWILKPQNARLWYETVLAFLDEHVRGEDWKRPALL